ncbi:hypothetical protein C8J57DRAFT_1508274 [Mycena rebaudengoi]|nr:hypothetical protein C8J57DRAFT_1508274 [Mycena rebaudengoi]
MKFTTTLFALIPLMAALPLAVRTVEADVKNSTALVSPTPNTQGVVHAFIDINFQDLTRQKGIRMRGVEPRPPACFFVS